jgi:AmmeMemoRadiSam system protein A
MEPSFSPEEERALLALADESIRRGLDGEGPLVPDLDGLPEALLRKGGAFVTVTVDGDLNGCIGTLEGEEPLARSVARLAWDSAFGDPRLPTLRRAEYGRMRIEISVLSPLEPVEAPSEEALLAVVRPGVDGLLIESGRHRATFLPAVWEKIADPRQFLDQLFLKAGLPPGRWPSDLQVWRYTAEKITTS